MDVKKLKAALKTANEELSTVIDGKTKARDLKGFRSLIAAGQHFEAAEKQIDKAVAQSAVKAPAASTEAAAGKK